MSVELLPTLEKDVVSKNKTSSTKTGEPKKEGGSLFDSLMKDAVQNTPERKISSTQTTKDSSGKNETIPTETKSKSGISSNKIEDQETPIKKMVNTLVEIVVEKSKEENLKKDLAKNKDLKIDTKQSVKTKKLLLVEEEPKVKENIEKNVSTIKETAKELSEVVASKEQNNVKENSSLAGSKSLDKKQTSETNLETVKDKIVVIEKATQKIEKEIQKVVSKEDIKTGTKEITESKADNPTVESLQSQSDENKSSLKQKVEQKVQIITKTAQEIKEEIKDKNNPLTNNKSESDTKVQVTTKVSTEQLADKVEQKVEIITSAADDIQKEVSKVVFVSSDQLIKKIQEFKNEEHNNNIEKKKIVIVPSSKEMQNAKVDEAQSNDKNSVLGNTFLTVQKQEKNKVSMKSLHDAKKNIQENKTVGAVKQSAEDLELNPDEIEVEQVGEKGESKSELFAKHEKKVQEQFLQNKSLNKMAIEQRTQNEAVDEEIEKQAVQNKSTQESDAASSKQKETTVNINVPSGVSETIQTKIIGAQQRMGSFMSEVARNMYLNYKPPFTSFRMNLNPANLGTISIVMRANKNDTNLNISMNMSSNATMDSFVENKAALQNALQRHLGEGSNVTLNFGMQNGNDSQSFDSNMNQSQNNSSSTTQNDEGEAIVQNSIEQEEVTQTLNYM